jgi:tetratricopeptide (TPR) repeat protein
VIGLAEAYRAAGQWGASVPLVEHVLEKQRTVCGPTHSDTIYTMHVLAMNYADVDRLEESMALHEQALKSRKSQNGPAIKATWCMLTFSQVCQRAGKLDRADKLLREALAINRNHENSQGRRNATANTLGWLALNLSLQQRYDEAEPIVREAVAMNQNEEKRRFQWVSLLGAVLLGQQKYIEAEPFLLQGYEGLKQGERKLFAGEKRMITEAGERVVGFYEVTNQPEKARAWREKLQQDTKSPCVNQLHGGEGCGIENGNSP